jgi:type I site-specific restriction-modification system R (restriction) subunit
MEALKNYQTLKQELKQLAVELKTDKIDIKNTQKECGPGSASILQYQIRKKKHIYRHKHIAYSMMRGRTYEQIESKCRENNKSDQNLIRELINEYGTQNVRACA